MWWLAALHGLVALALFAYGLNWYVLVALLLRSLKRPPAPTPLPDEWPEVTIQLPVYNERWVACRLLAAVCRLDYPRHLLHVQVLDDSTDETADLLAEEVRRWRGMGIRVERIARADRAGFKAGALQHGMKISSAPFLAVFDADFVPPRNWLRRALPPLLRDPALALVQTRWDHLNRNDSLLTRVQALGIDGHFAVEQPARAWNGLFANFNGTAGVWRRAAIEDAGGWQGDTLTEDLDLSYRAQLRGWRIEYLLDVRVPAEVPDDVRSVKSQQFRWAKGSLQTARKLLGPVWRSGLSLAEKVQATLHLTTYLIHPLMLASILLALPMAPLAALALPLPLAAVGLVTVGAGFAAPTVMYATGQLVLDRRGWRRLVLLPALLALGVGIAVSNTRAVWQALAGTRGEFVRTPKRGQRADLGRYRLPAGAESALELGMAAYCAVTAAVYATMGLVPVAVLLGLYGLGFAWVGLGSMAGELVLRRAALALLLALGSTLLLGAGDGLEWTVVKETIRRSHPEVARMQTAELARLLEGPPEGRPLLLDVRAREEYEVSHLKGALRADESVLAAMEAGGRDRFVVLYCSVGARSAEAADRLRRAGMTRVYNLEGSIFQWANEGRPVYRGSVRVDKVHPYDRLWGRLLETERRAPLP